jgi:hypothetical protein
VLGAFARVFVCLVAPNDTARTRPQQTVVTRKVVNPAAEGPKLLASKSISWGVPSTELSFVNGKSETR